VDAPRAGVAGHSAVSLTLRAYLRPLTKKGAAETVLHCRLIGHESRTTFYQWIVSVPVRYPFRMSADRLEWGNVPPEGGERRRMEVRALTDLEYVEVTVPPTFVVHPSRVGPLSQGQVARFTIEPDGGPQRGSVRAKGRVSARTADGASCWFEFQLRAFRDGYARIVPNPVLLGVVRPGDEIQLAVWRRDGQPLRSVDVDMGELPLAVRDVVQDQPHMWTLVLRVGETTGGYLRGTCRIRVLSAGGAEDVWDVLLNGHVWVGESSGPSTDQAEGG